MIRRRGSEPGRARGAVPRSLRRLRARRGEVSRGRERARDAVQEAFASRCASAARSGVRARSRPGSGGSCSTPRTDMRRASPGRLRRAGRSRTAGPKENAELRAALARLPERQRTSRLPRYYADLDYAAIGEALGIADGTVAATLNAAHTALAPAWRRYERDRSRPRQPRSRPSSRARSADWDDVLRRSGAPRAVVAAPASSRSSWRRSSSSEQRLRSAPCARSSSAPASTRRSRSCTTRARTAARTSSGS